MSASEFAHPPGADRSFAAFIAALPDVLVARDFRAVVDAIAAAATRKRGVVLMLGGHVVKTGLAPLIIDLMRRGIVTHLAMNGSAAIHDYEVARFGATSEDVAAGLRDGTFGMAEETGREMNDAFVSGMKSRPRHGRGRGPRARRATRSRESRALDAAQRAPPRRRRHGARRARRRDHSSAPGGKRRGDRRYEPPRLPPSRRVARDLDDGGVVLNVGSAVVMPEVFLKALTIARNLNDGRPRNFVSVDLDMQRHYRPRMNVVQRPTLESGKGYEITGHHEIMVPLLAWAVVERMSR